eukprot:c5064_g1_i1.p1 GENE.c5064_g1_i1~~c5064_g1_i1.p1  ORF type:complete len:563 (+),score=139.68 c5064_g1_i1:2-1690(+)
MGTAITIESSNFSENTAANGGAVAVNSATTSIDEVNFISNSATLNGGALVLEGSTGAVVSDSTFERNGAVGGDGGAVVVKNCENVLVIDSVMKDNSAGGGGGAMYLDQSSVDVSGTTVENNTATYGAALTSQPTKMNITRFTTHAVVNKFFSQSIELSLFDQFGQLVSTSNEYTASVSVNDTDTTLFGSRFVPFESGIATFDSLSLFSGCDQNHLLIFSVSGVNLEPISRTIYLECSPEHLDQWVLTGISIFFGVVDLVLMYLMFANRKVASIRRSSPTFCVLQLFGDLVMVAGVITNVETPSDVTCGCSLVFWTCGFTVAYGSLFVKTWRVWKLFDNKTLERLVLPNSLLLGAVSVMLLIDILLLIFTFIFYPPKSSTTPLKDLDLAFTVCDYQISSPPVIVLAIYKVCVIVYGVVIAYRIRRLFQNEVNKKDFNESYLIGYCLYNVWFFMVLVIPIIAVLNDQQWKLRYVLSCIAIIVTSQFNAILLFIPKVLRLYKDILLETDTSASHSKRLKSLFTPGAVNTVGTSTVNANHMSLSKPGKPVMIKVGTFTSMQSDIQL